MAILILEVTMLVAGIVALIRGEIPLTKVHHVDGWPARMAGFFLLLPLPLAFAIGFVIGLVQGMPADPNNAANMTLLIDVPILAICAFLAIGIGIGSACAEAWAPRTYLSDTEGPLGSWNDPYMGPAGLQGPTRRPRRKKKRSRARTEAVRDSS